MLSKLPASYFFKMNKIFFEMKKHPLNFRKPSKNTKEQKVFEIIKLFERK